MPKTTAPKRADKARHDPLHAQLKNDEIVSQFGKVSQPGKRQKKRDPDAEDQETILDSKTSQRIFALAKEQQDELGEEEDEDDEDNQNYQPRTNSNREYDDDDDEEEADSIIEGSIDAEEYAERYINEEDMKTLDALLPSNAGERKTLADMIFSKLEESEARKAHPTGTERHGREFPDPAAGMNPKVVEVYTKVGHLLSVYKSGPLPKAFKMIPALPQWARILALTNPTQWTPHATNVATRIFISNLKPAQARVFLEGVLLERVRTNIADSHDGKKLDVHLFEALRKALYKPGAFFKGILFPLVQGGCTLKEAAIIASVLANSRIPMLHSAAALGRLASLPQYTGPSSLFIRVLLDKKYALPYQTLDILVHFFIRISNTYKAGIGQSEKLPVLWHQSLLVFCQRFAADLAPDQKDALLDVVRAHPHHEISQEIRRELTSVPTGQSHPNEDVAMET